MLITGVLMAASLLVSDPDGVVTTAPATVVDLTATAPVQAPAVQGAVQATPHGLSTDEQIDRWLSDNAAPETNRVSGLAPWVDDRKMHSEFTAGIGTGGYRDYGAAVSVPIGENGRLDLSYRQTENGYGYGYGYDRRYPFGVGYGDSLFDDSGYVFPGRREAGAALRFESRVQRPDGPPQGRTTTAQPEWSAP